MKSKPMFDKKRPVSWSFISSFEYDPEQWYRKYVLRNEDTPTKEMEFGSKIGKMIETNPDFMIHVPRQNHMEFPFETKFSKIPIIGIADSFCTKTYKAGEEYKTGKKEWNQKRVDEHGQITMYTLMNYLIRGIRPEEVQWRLTWIPTFEDGDFSIQLVNPQVVYSFETRRTMEEVLEFGARIKRVYKEAETYCKNHA